MIKVQKGVSSDREGLFVEFNGGARVAVSAAQDQDNDGKLAFKLLHELVSMPWAAFNREETLAIVRVLMAGLEEFEVE